jgi:N-acetylglutamate synthase-like GNAT family acetyltransferase
MNSSNYRVRRATLDDVGQLLALWQSMQFPADELARRVTDFQVAEDGEGKVVGAVGLQIAERQGRIHSEAFTDFSMADSVRQLFWDRLNSVATNHGLLRLWTREQAPFWTHCGLTKADPEVMEKLPALWRGQASGWLTLKLKDALEEVISADKEFAMFMQAEKQRTKRAFQHARILKVIATLIALALLGLVAVGAFLVIQKNPGLLHR